MLALPSRSCERMFVTSQGSAYGRFKKALAHGNPLIALASARELPRLSLADALALLLVLRADPDLYQRAAARFHARFVIDTKLGAADSALLLAALNGLAGPTPPPPLPRYAPCSKRRESTTLPACCPRNKEAGAPQPRGG